MYDALDVAMYIIDRCYNDGHPVTNLRLQKLLYFVQGVSYQQRNKRLFDNDFYAWPYGPVIPEVYFQYCGYAGVPIRMNYDIEIKSDIASLIDNTIDMFSPYSDWDLVDFTHEDGSPWCSHEKNRGRIPKNEIKQYFRYLEEF